MKNITNTAGFNGLLAIPTSRKGGETWGTPISFACMADGGLLNAD
jgi:hypothetical protein